MWPALNCPESRAVPNYAPSRADRLVMRFSWNVLKRWLVEFCEDKNRAAKRKQAINRYTVPGIFKSFVLAELDKGKREEFHLGGDVSRVRGNDPFMEQVLA